MAVVQTSSDGIAMLCTSSFVDEVTFKHVPVARHVYSKVVIELGKYNSQDTNQTLLNDKIPEVLIMNCTLGAKSAIYSLSLIHI